MQYPRKTITAIQTTADNSPAKVSMLRAQLKKHRLIIAVILMMPIAFIMDSPVGDSLLIYGQAVMTFIAFLVFIFIAYKKSSYRVRQIMLIGMFIGLGIETFFSLILGWYHYRFWNIPLWLAFGHGLVFWLTSKLARITWIKSVWVQYSLLTFAMLYSISWLYIARDWFGFLCMIGLFIVLYINKRARPFLLVMFAIVAYIEQVGTAAGCWHWSTIIMGIPSANPPSGIVFFYLTFEILTLWIYLNILYPKTKKRYLGSSFRKNKQAT